MSGCAFYLFGGKSVFDNLISWFEILKNNFLLNLISTIPKVDIKKKSTFFEDLIYEVVFHKTRAIALPSS